MSDNVQRSLQAYYAQACPAKQGLQVKDLSSITAGWESEMYAFDVEYGPAEDRRREALILRLYPGDQAHAKAAHEFHSMRQLRQAGYPVPYVHMLERTNSPFGKPCVIMERIAGQVMGPLFSSARGEQQREILRRFCALFVQLHRLDWRPFVNDGARGATQGHIPDPRHLVAAFVDDEARDVTQGPYGFVDRSLRRAHDALAQFSLLGFRPIVAWLEERRDAVPCQQPALVHGDFHPNNILLRDDGSAVVIDWAGLQVSNARFDLAWTLLLTGTHGSVEWRDAILQEYERLVGAKVEQLEWFETFACLRRLRVVTVSLSEGAEKLGLRPDAVTRMQQQMGAIQQVYALLLERTGIRVAEVERLCAVWS
jgi:aminoglycoside phosphotransferase (APT) family kinase protein